MRAASTPPLNSVLLRVTPTIERDYVRRGVFPRIRQAHALTLLSAAELHLLSPDEAGELLEDARASHRVADRGLKNAYRGLVSTLTVAMEEAREREKAFSETAAVAVRISDTGETWRGTKDQLLAHGIKPCREHQPWPFEPGAKKWIRAKDSRGYNCTITRFAPLWPGLYEAHITIPFSVWGKQREHERTDPEVAQRSLEAMPKTADEFRVRVVQWMRRDLRNTLDLFTKLQDWHGFTLAEGVFDEVEEAFDAVVAVFEHAEVRFDAARHAEIAQGYRAQIAAGDPAFQAKLSWLTRAKPALLQQEGGQ